MPSWSRPVFNRPVFKSGSSVHGWASKIPDIAVDWHDAVELLGFGGPKLELVVRGV
jgi:hypothetical protein